MRCASNAVHLFQPSSSSSSSPSSSSPQTHASMLYLLESFAGSQHMAATFSEGVKRSYYGKLNRKYTLLKYCLLLRHWHVDFHLLCHSFSIHIFFVPCHSTNDKCEIWEMLRSFMCYTTCNAITCVWVRALGITPECRGNVWKWKTLARHIHI